jgi:putative ABC transport system permease protein
MSIRSRVSSLLRSLLHRRELENDLDAELRSCFELLVDRYQEQGLAPEEAVRLARLEFEGFEQVKEQVREIHMRFTLDSFLQDVRCGWRALRKNPAFAAVAVLTLALGIGVNTAIFSLVYAVLLRPLPYHHPEQLALIWSNYQKMSAARAPASGPMLGEIEHRNRLLDSVGAIWVGNATLAGQDVPEQVKLGFVTNNFFQVLGVHPALGRAFTSEEGSGGRFAVILNDALWHRRFGGDPDIVGKAVDVLGGSATVVGVMPADFRLHLLNVAADVPAFVPFGSNLSKRPLTLYFLSLIARLKPGVTVAQAQSDLDSVAQQIRGIYTPLAAENLTFSVVGMQADAVREIRPGLIALYGGAAFVLLICYLNVANLLLARATDRRKEIAVRSALGASRGRVLRQLLTEGVLLCAIAGSAGVALAWAGVRWLNHVQPDSLARSGKIGLSWPVLAFATAISIVSVLMFAIAPSLKSTKSDLMKALREAGRTSQAPSRRGVRAALIVTEIALGFVLLISAGLMIRTFEKIQSVRPGFDPQSLLTFEIDLNAFDGPERRSFVKEWEAQIDAMPGVDAAGGVSHLPLGDYGNWYSSFRPEGIAPNDAAALLADFRAVTPGYLRAMGTRLLEGRTFDDRDRAGGNQVAVVDEIVAHSTWPNQSAVGKRIEAEHMNDRGGFEERWTEIVGVIEHIDHHSLARQLRGEIYFPYEQSPREHLAFGVRALVDPLSLAGPIREKLRQRDPKMALFKVRPMAAYVETAKAPAAFTAVLAATFAALALLLAAIGIYGVTYYSVSRRMHEMGVRMALGANGRDVMRMIFSEGLIFTGIGMVLGFLGAIAASRELAGLVYGVPLSDPLTYGVVLVVIPATAILACWRPASKASSANPADVLRAE